MRLVESQRGSGRWCEELFTCYTQVRLAVLSSQPVVPAKHPLSASLERLHDAAGVETYGGSPASIRLLLMMAAARVTVIQVSAVVRPPAPARRNDVQGGLRTRKSEIEGFGRECTTIGRPVGGMDRSADGFVGEARRFKQRMRGRRRPRNNSTLSQDKLQEQG